MHSRALRRVLSIAKFSTFLLLLIIVVAGLLAACAHQRSTQRRATNTAATIIFQITDYGTDGSELGRWNMRPRQYSDGRWKVHMDDVNGKPVDSSGGIDPAFWATPEDFAAQAIAMGRRRDQVLGYTVFVQKDPSRTEFWFSPELNTTLKEVVYQNGKIGDVTEAVSVTVGEPVE